MNDTVTLYSHVEAALIKKMLLRGSILAAVGVVPLVLAGAYLPLAALIRWGWLILAAGFFLIARGLLPYRRLVRLQQHPHSLLISSDGSFTYRDHTKRPRFTIPFSAVSDITYVSRREGSGIAIHLKDAPAERVTLHHPPFDIRRLSNDEGDLFLPLFDRASYHELRTCVLDS